MKRFKFKARNPKGELIKGEVEASNDRVAAKLIRDKGSLVISIKPKNQINLELFRQLRGHVGRGSVVNFTRQMATMINAGMPITESLLILRSQSEGPMQSVISQILSDVEGGESLSSSISKFPKIFDKTYVALIKSGEIGGVLDQVLAKLADNLEKEQEFRGKIKGAMIYPAVITLAMIGVAFVMLVFVIPKLTSIYDQFDVELPITTKLLISVSTFMSQRWYFVLLTAFAGIYMLKIYHDTENGDRKIDGLVLRTPVIGELRKQVILADITRTMSLMVGSGVSILEALNISAEAVNSKLMADALRDASKMVEKGFPVSYTFTKNPDIFPFILSQMVSVGEETGKMDEVLAKVSHVFEVESDQKLKTITSMVEPSILIILGVGVAFLVVSIILPIYNLTTQL